jgi:serine/threonine protein kinase
MTDAPAELEARLGLFVEHHVIKGEQLDAADLCRDRPDLVDPLRTLIDRYLSLTVSLDADDGADAQPMLVATNTASLPSFEGFQTIERIGSGGMGEVFKLRDTRLNRVVAAKVLRQGGWNTRIGSFLNEAKALALFSDRRIVQIYECRVDSDPPVIIMELVEGFELGRLGPSLEYPQRARILVEICEAVHHAHTLGLQHRDLKPSNIMLDARLSPRILDFGLSAGDPTRGHFVGTLPYVAPEQLDPSRPIDARTDVYALGVILYELLCGRPPYAGDDRTLVDAIRAGLPRLPVEISSSIPEPLQAIALTAMERDPARRYQSAQDMAADLQRFLSGLAVHGRPTIYATTLGARIRPHLDDIGEWLRLRLLYPHEADRLRSAYGAFDAREEDWIVESRALSYTQIALYLGAFLLLCGSLFYFVAARWYDHVQGALRPFIVLGLPFIGLNVAAHHLYRRDQKAVAVAFYLAAVVLLPLFLLILFDETQLLVAPPGASGQLFDGEVVSNRQLQVTSLVACLWCGWLALRTRTAALSTVFTVLAFVFTIAVISDFGLRAAIEDRRWDRLALRLFPLVVAYALAGMSAERRERQWFSRPLYIGSAALFVAVLELYALDGRALRQIGGFSLAPWQSARVSNPALLDTVAVMTVNGALFYAVADAIARFGSFQSQAAAQLLFAISPFALIHPLGYLVRTGEYSPRVDWLYASCAIVIMLLSQRRQRRSFYYAGMLNLGIALYLIAVHREWFERPGWAIAVIVAGLAALAAGFFLDRGTRRRAGGV